MNKRTALLLVLLAAAPMTAQCGMGVGGYVRDALGRGIAGVRIDETTSGDPGCSMSTSHLTDGNGYAGCPNDMYMQTGGPLYYQNCPYVTAGASMPGFTFSPGPYIAYVGNGGCISRNWVRTNNDVPVLACTGETDYVISGVAPVIEMSGSTFTFRVRYTDANNDDPYGYMRVVIRKGADIVKTLPMNLVSGTYSGGAIYSTGTLLAPCSFYTYTFEANDGFGSAAAFGDQPGPAVYTYISGVVRNIDASPMAGIAISLSGDSDRNAVTAADGSYAFTMLPPGSYTVSSPAGFEPASISTALVDKLAGADFIMSNTGATLSWTGEPGYTADGVNPDIGVPENPFEFRIIYKDAENDAPAAGFPRVIIKKGGNQIGGSPFTMAAADASTDYIGGKIYRAGPVIALLGTDYTYYIEVRDARSSVVTATSAVRNLTVSHQPTLTWTGSAGYAADGIDPDTGTISATYTFRIKYRDADNLPPDSGYPKVHIYKSGVEMEGGPFAMSYISGNHNTGSIYSYERALPIGMDYAYEFEARNQYLSTAVVRGGYGPQVRARVSGYVKDAYNIPLSNIAVTLSGAESRIYKTATDGYYEFLITTEAYTVTPSSYTYYNFTPPARSYEGLQADSAAENYARETTAPFLTLTNEPNYMSSAVYPAVAQSGSTYTFRVKYWSDNNDAPAPGYPRVTINKGGTTSQLLPMNYISGDYRVSGAIYSTATLLAPCSYYTYAVEAKDVFNNAATPLAAAGPDVRAYISGRVRNADNAPMGDVTVSLTGSASDEMITSTDGAYIFNLLPVGGNYIVTPSSHTYYTFTPISRSTTLADNLTGWDLARTNTAPTLAWPIEAGYAGIRGVWPSTGTTNSDVFVFKTVFTDIDDDNYSSLNLYIRKGNVVVSTIPLGDCYGSFHSGLTCSYGTVIGTSGVYSYSFGAVGRWGETVSTPERTFLSMIAPTVPVNDGAAITDNQSFVSAEVTLKWAAADPEGGTLTYDLYVSLAASQVLSAKKIAGYQTAASAAASVYSGPNTSYILRNLSPGRTYYWKVNATNQYGVTTQGTLMNFLTLDLPIDKIFNYPNPFNPARQQTNIVYSVNAPQTIKVRIYSEYGDLVRTLEAAATDGTNELRFDGRDKNGRMLYNGSYIAVIERAEGPAKCYLLIVK